MCRFVRVCKRRGKKTDGSSSRNPISAAACGLYRRVEEQTAAAATTGHDVFLTNIVYILVVRPSSRLDLDGHIIFFSSLDCEDRREKRELNPTFYSRQATKVNVVMSI